jgi:hypothetical protein
MQTVTSSLAPDLVWPLAPGMTTEEHLAQIQLLGQRIQEHLRFVVAAANLPGTSAEARARAVVAFHERLALMERGLAKTLEDLRLA